MSLALTQAAPPRIQVHHGDGFVTCTVSPASFGRVRGRIAMGLLTIGAGMLFALFGPFSGVKEGSESSFAFAFLGGMFVIGWATYHLQALGYQANAGKASITIGPSDVIVRFSGWHGSSSLHWLRAEIQAVTARRNRHWDTWAVRMFGRFESVLLIETVTEFSMQVLDTLFLSREEARWLADALRRELELPQPGGAS